MGTKDKIGKALLEAIRSRDKIKKRALRMAISSIKLVEIKKGEDLDEPTLFNILQKEIRIKQETIEELKKANRDQAVEVEYAEIAVIKKFLPQPISDEGLKITLEQIIQETGAQNVKDVGKVMKIAIQKIQGRASNSRVSQAVKAILLSKNEN
jgi:uncharacterized protein YqeY